MSKHLTTWRNRIQDPRRLHALKVRTLVEKSIRACFESNGFSEVHTPLLVASPGMECHIRPIQVLNTERPVYLPTSPEFAMKKLLAGGMEKIFQICPAFRNEPMSSTHHPEFTMLEWYRAQGSEPSVFHEVQNDVENLFEEIQSRVPESRKWLNLKRPWPRLRIRELFKEFLGVDLLSAKTTAALAEVCKRKALPVSSEDTWDDLYFKLWLNFIEPKLPADRAVFVVDYPTSQSALARVEKGADGELWAQRFEVYAGGLELGNAFFELLDPNELVRRYEKEMDARARQYGPDFPSNPMDDDFVRAMREGLPPSAGIAMGVDRLVQLFSGEKEIDRTFWISSHW